MSSSSYDVIVIGGGHAGAEAAWAAARLGARTALVTFERQAIGRMSCNPAIGGIGKGQMVREVDALGGLMGVVTDQTGIQFRMLNRSKGPAVWAPRAQADRELYAACVREHLEQCPNLTILEAGVESIEAEPVDEGKSSDSPVPLLCEQCAEDERNGENTAHRAVAHEPRDSAAHRAVAHPQTRSRITGVTLTGGRVIRAKTVVVTSGTFLRALMHCGESKTEGGRIGEAAAVGLSGALARLGLELGRLKTGTPPRVARDSVDYSLLTEQPGDSEPAPFSFMTERITQPQVCCWLTHTNAEAHELIRANLHRAPMYSGQIQSRGPRYCPSIEDKVVRFADKTQHQVFLEPEGRDNQRIYVNGISTSLPQDVQAKIVALIPGLERARIVQWGYAVEYDFVPPEQIDATLMTKHVTGLFLAGQINGTSGYEEAAGQGIVAGINAARFCAGAPGVTIGRDMAYIGVMIDDLVTRGVLEPYRMFTSRAEHRMHLRYDNADARLTPLGRQIGLVSDERWQRFQSKGARIAALRATLERLRCEGKSIAELLRRPDEDGNRFVRDLPELAAFHRMQDVWAAALVELKYAGYIDRQNRAIAEFRQLEDRLIPAALNFSSVRHLRKEAVERWTAVRPSNIGQAARVSGIHPTDVALLLVQLSALDRS